MALNHADRVRETSATTGTGTYSLAGAVTGYRGFVAGVGTTNTCYYAATDGTDWEVGLGTVTDGSPDTLARTSILKSSNSNAAVSWGAGDKTIFTTLPAEVYQALSTFVDGLPDTFNTLLGDSGAPSGGDGVDGDFWLDVDNGDLYYKASGSWSLLSSLAGSNGTDGTSPGIQRTYNNTTTMADPGTGLFRLNNGTLLSVTAIAIDDLSALTGNPDESGLFNTWDDSTASIKGYMLIRQRNDASRFAVFRITGLTDNSGWSQFASSNTQAYGSSFQNGELCDIDFYRTGDNGTFASATQSEAEAASSTTVAMTPGNAHWHPSSVKAWGKAAGNASTLNAGYGMTSVTNGAAGINTWNLSVTFSSVNYAIATALLAAATTTNLADKVTAQNTTSIAVIAETSSSGADTDPTNHFVMACGDL